MKFPNKQKDIIAYCNRHGVYNFEISKARNVFMIQTDKGCQNVCVRSVSKLSFTSWFGIIDDACKGKFYVC